LNTGDHEHPEERTGPVLYYTEAVIDHFMRPRNVGEIDIGEANGFAEVGDPSCGDTLKLWLVVQDKTISRIGFRTFGCPGAIATSSMMTVLALGKTLDAADSLTDDDVIDALGGIPERKKHCSLLGVQALRSAILNHKERSQPPGSP
jgi:nitrogen fixation NifU-like protein